MRGSETAMPGTYVVEFANEQYEIVGRTDPIDMSYSGLVAMPPSMHGTTVCFYRPGTTPPGEPGTWLCLEASVPNEGVLAESVTLTVGTTAV